MNDCYWGGHRDRYYYECDTGRIIGSIDGSDSTTYAAYYKETVGNPYIGEYIDCDRARKAVEAAHRLSQENLQRQQEAWKNLSAVRLFEYREPKKSWWMIGK